MLGQHAIRIGRGDALIVVDLQNDFLSGGALAVPDGDAVVPLMNRCIDLFEARHRPIFATRDWHPREHCSFEAQGGPWPVHCVRGTDGADFARELTLPASAVVISKGERVEADAYSGFDGTDLAERLRLQHAKRVFVGGLATDFCVRATVNDALEAKFAVVLLTDAVRAVEVTPGDGRRAIEEMQRRGARPATLRDLAA